MALIKCPKCGKMFSVHAKACPQCGMSYAEIIKKAGQEQNESIKRVVVITAANLLIILIIIVVCLLCSN